MNKGRKGKPYKPQAREGSKDRVSPAATPERPAGAELPAPDLEKMLKGKSLYIYLVLAALLALYVFRNFITFNQLYLYKDIGSDTVTYWWPHWVMLSYYIHSLGVPAWSFNQGMGQNIYAFGIGDPFSLFLCLLPKQAIPYAIIFTELFKIIGGGLIICWYLKMINCSDTASIAGGLLFAFSGYVILGSGWYFVSTETFYAALVLYSVERYLRQGIWYLLPIPFCLFGMFQPFFLYLYGLLAAVYCMVRGVLLKNDWKKTFVTLLKMAGFAAFGVLLGSAVFFPNAYQLINNPRVGGGASQFKTLFSSPIFSLTPNYISSNVISRLFSNDLTGTGSNFKGWGNYLEAPVLYIGLISLLLAPQAFLFMEKHKRKVMIILTALCLLPLAFTWFRYAFWLFAVPYFRTYTFFISLLILYLAIRAFTGIGKTYIVHVKTLLGTLVVLLFLLYHDFTPGFSRIVDTSLRSTVAVFLVIYTLLIYLYGIRKFRLNATLVIALCLLIELAMFSNITVNRRVVMNSSELTDRTGYNDYTADAVTRLKAADKGFYRIAKDYYPNAAVHICLNDPQILNYRGLTSYAEWNQPNYYNFLEELHTSNWADTDNQIAAKWVRGPVGRYLLYTFANVKYMLSRQPANTFASAGYSPDGTYGDVQVSRNSFYLPFGYSYDKYITLNEFRKIHDLTRKDVMLLTAFVPPTDLQNGLNGMQQVFAKDTVVNFTYPQYGALVDSLKKDSLNITFFDDNHIRGTFKTDREKLLFLTIPYDQGWKAEVDGKAAETIKANIGFTGLFMEKGMHSVSLTYTVPFLTLGALVSLLAALIYGFALFRYRKSRIQV